MFLPDATLAHLREVADWPDLAGTRYEALARVGAGGQSTVYRARDRELDREVAIKVLAGPVSADASARLRAEAQLLARLEHPGLVPVHDAGVLPDGRPYYVMALVRGERLDAWRRRSHSLPDRLRLVQRVAEALAFAHAQGIVHRDLKPANVMVGAFGQVLVMDWGIAMIPGGPAVAAIAGTPGFMAPEQARGDAVVDARADVFALGALLDWITAPGADDPGAPVPAAIRAIVTRATAEDPSDRYGDVRALSADISRYLDGLRVEAHAEGLLERVQRFGRTYRTAILLVAAYLAMRITLLIYSGL